jgi:hypothetical protein
VRYLKAAFILLTLAFFAGSAWAADTQFPLRVSPDGRHLEDSSGKPFLIVGDAAWSLIAELKRDEVDTYLDARRKLGFNAILASLIEHEFSSQAPADASGEKPFKTEGSFAEPNERYFENAKWILRRAQEKGFLVFLAPAYLGVNGGSQGWQQEMIATGPEGLEAYGRYIGALYKDLPNIIWVHGCDNDPPDKRIVEAVVEGIERSAPGSLHTVSSSRGTVMLDIWPEAKWLSLNTVYVYENIYTAVATQYERAKHLPVLFFEGLYENERGTTAQVARSQAYGAMLAGAAGQIFGNNPMWHFSGPGVDHSELTWQESLSSRGAKSMEYLRALFESLPWWLIAPDGGKLLPAGSTAVAGTASDGSFSIVYLSDPNAIEVNGAALKGTLVASWLDPSSGAKTDAKGSSVANGLLSFTPPSPRNADGDSDWILLLNTQS